MKKKNQPLKKKQPVKLTPTSVMLGRASYCLDSALEIYDPGLQTVYIRMTIDNLMDAIQHNISRSKWEK